MVPETAGAKGGAPKAAARQVASVHAIVARSYKFTAWRPCMTPGGKTILWLAGNLHQGIDRHDPVLPDDHRIGLRLENVNGSA